MIAGQELWTEDKFVLVFTIDRKSKTVRPDPAMLADQLRQLLDDDAFNIELGDWAVSDISPAF